jgi:hypothetical protein
MFEIISLNDKKKWDEIIRSMSYYDFYHLAEYNQLNDSGTPLLLYFENNSTAFAFPVILRSIEGSTYYDITSVYGYAGPLAKTKTPDMESLEEFHSNLKDFMDANHIVSAFARLHPLFTDQEQILSGLGDVVKENLTVAIDLTLPEEDQRRQYSRSLRYKINYLKKKGISIIKAGTKHEIDSFIDIYTENMRRVNASELYFFSPEYFYRFLENIPSVILLAVHNDEIVSGSLCTFCNGIMQAHLNATRDNYLFISPLKLVLDNARFEGIRKNMTFLHLGGGRNGMDDSLFTFKSRFSDLYFRFKTWRYIHNKEIYDKLIYNKFDQNVPQSTFFPLYRA